MAYSPKSLTRNAVRFTKPRVMPQPEDVYRRQFIKFINTLRCPICQSGLDGAIDNQANIYCRTSPQEYHAQYMQGTFMPNKDCIKLTDYQIDHQQLSGNRFRTTVWFTQIGGYPNGSTHKRIMEYEGEILFGATSFNKEVFLKKMELYDVFS